MAYRPYLLGFIIAASAAGAFAQTQTPPPPSIRTKIQAMDTACGVAGGRPAGGAYIFRQDFSGDGVPDYLVSEGGYQCAGKPDAFRANGHANIQIFVTSGADAQSVFYESVRGYRIIPGAPSQVQVVRDTGTVTLAYNGGRFVAGGQAAPVDPLAQVGARPPAAAGAAAAPAAAAPPPAAAGSPETQAAFQARCVRERMARYKGLTQKIADSSCQSIWPMAQAANPAATALLAVGGGAPGPMTPAAAKAAVPGVAWGGAGGRGVVATGKQGQWEVNLHGAAQVEAVSFQWAKVGQPIPYDIPEAMRIKGARLSEIGCLNLGAGEGGRVYRVDFPGRPAFVLTVYQRDAPTASANSSYAASADLKGGPMTLAALKRNREYADFEASCPD